MSNYVAAMRALLNHKDPTVAAQGRKMVKASRDPAVRALLTNKSAAGVASAIHGSQRANRGAKATSKAGISVPAVEGKVARPATSSKPGSRWAHFAGMTLAAPIAAEPKPADPTISPADAAAFVIASAAKARGQRVAAPAKPPAAVRHDMSTPEGVAAFVAASAAKARGGRR